MLNIKKNIKYIILIFITALIDIFSMSLPYQEKINALSAASLKGLSYVVFPGGFQTKQDLDLGTPLVGFLRVAGLVIPSFFILQKMDELSGLHGIKYDNRNLDYYSKYFSRKFLFAMVTLTSFFKMNFIKSMACSADATALSKINSILFSFFNNKKSNNIQFGLLGLSLVLFYLVNIRTLKQFDIEEIKIWLNSLQDKKQKVYENVENDNKNINKDNQKKINQLKAITEELVKTLTEQLTKIHNKEDKNKISFLEKYMIVLRLEIFNRRIQEINFFVKNFQSEQAEI